MSTTAPKIDPRTAADIATRLTGTVTPKVVGLLERYTTHPDAPAQQYPFERWREYDPVTGQPSGISAALIGIFARFAEIVIERLNQVPEKNFLAFLDLLGAVRQPPQPARVPLQFSLAAGSLGDAPVPAGTQVAAPPAPGDKDPVVFETERPLVATAVQLSALLTLDPGQDTYGDWSERLSVAVPEAFPVFAGNRAIEHGLYLGDERLLGYPQIANLRLDVTLTQPLPDEADGREVIWERWDGTLWQKVVPLSDSTENLKQSGTIEFGAVEPQPETRINAVQSRWLRGRLLTPIQPMAIAVAGMVRASQLPQIAALEIEVDLTRTLTQGIGADLGFTNALPIDLTKAFFPFGEQPKQLDTLYLASAEAFSKDRATNTAEASAQIELDVELLNSHLVPGTGSVWPSRDLELAWEGWTGKVWQRVGTSKAPDWLSLLEIDPPPALITADTAVLQGTAQRGANLTVTDPRGAIRSVPIGPDGRFAVAIPLGEGFNTSEFTAISATAQCRAWAVVFRGTSAEQKVLIEIKAPADPVDAASVELSIQVTGENASQVNGLRLTEGRTGKTLDAEPDRPISVPLEEGRTELLVEALGDDAQILAVRTVTLARRAAAPLPDAAGFADGTFGLCQSGVVTLRLPDTTARTAVNGQESFWLRVRLVQGDYGKEAAYVLKNPVQPEDGFTLVPASFRPPIVAGLTLGYALTARRPPPICLTNNRLVFEDQTAAAGGFAPFAAASEATRPGLYLGFSLPAGRTAFPNTTISLYNSVTAPRYGERPVPLSAAVSVRSGTPGASVAHTLTISNPATWAEDFDVTVLGYRWPMTVPDAVHVEAGGTGALAVQVSIPAEAQAGDQDQGYLRLGTRREPQVLHGAVLTTVVGVLPDAGPPQLRWQYWNGTSWAKLTVQDDTEHWTRSGLIEFLAPSDLARHALFGKSCHWLRVTWEEGEYPVPPHLERMLLNTTLARQTTTVGNEILGSSNGAAGQQVQSTRSPILAGQQLEVREPEKPSTDEQSVLAAEEGADAIHVVTDAAGREREIWVRWHEVPDFYGSGPRDRHYVINHLTGEIRFGDGVNGRIPPPGTGNLRLARYQTGGGLRGNRAVGEIAQLKTTVPYVDKATNLEAAAGGAEAETTEALLERMPCTLRHRDRAVALEDYADLAVLASPEVARSRCEPLRDLVADPLGNTAQPGAVSVIIVPRTSAAKPLPTLELLARVREFLAARACATASLAVVGPLYLRVDVRAEVAVATLGGASTVERAVYEKLAAFLHPLTGGLQGNGWDFGRAPHRSDLFALIESVPDVDHVRYLQITEVEDQPGVRKTGRFLVFSGAHQVSLVFPST